MVPIIRIIVYWGLYCGRLCRETSIWRLSDVRRARGATRGIWGLPGPSNVVPFWVWYGFLVRTLIRPTKKVLHWRVLGMPTPCMEAALLWRLRT